MRRCHADVRQQVFELVFGAVRGKIGDLRLEGQRQVGGGIDDGSAKVVNARRVAAPGVRKARRVGV